MRDLSTQSSGSWEDFIAFMLAVVKIVNCGDIPVFKYLLLVGEEHSELEEHSKHKIKALLRPWGPKQVTETLARTIHVPWSQNMRFQDLNAF